MVGMTTPARARHILRVVAIVAALAVGAVLVGACVIADPPTPLPQLPEMRPTIIRASVVPPTTSVLGRWPSKFIVPVELSDAKSTLYWATFVDYNPATREGLDQRGESTYEPSSTQGRIRTLELPISMPSLDRCHVVEVVVALTLNTSDPRTAHTFEEPPGGDIATWFFSPSGDLSGCPILDAGLAPVVDDAGADSAAEAGSTEQ